jgi:hypothetical protein
MRLRSAVAFCIAHSGRVDMAAIGKKGVRARLVRKTVQKTDGRDRVRDEVRKAIERDPKAVVDALMSSAKGIEVLWALGYSEDAAGTTNSAAAKKTEFIVISSCFRGTGFSGPYGGILQDIDTGELFVLAERAALKPLGAKGDEVWF